jgi:hypothetical protein
MKYNNPFGLRIHGNLPFENREECVGISIGPHHKSFGQTLYTCMGDHNDVQFKERASNPYFLEKQYIAAFHRNDPLLSRYISNIKNHKSDIEIAFRRSNLHKIDCIIEQMPEDSDIYLKHHEEFVTVYKLLDTRNHIRRHRIANNEILTDLNDLSLYRLLPEMQIT